MKKFLTLILVLTVSAWVTAQTHDLGMWNTVSVNKELNDKLVLGFDQEIRFRDNITTLNLIYTNVGVTYKFTDFFKVGLVYRYIDKHKDDFSWGSRHRVYLDATVKVKPGRFNASYRARYQMEWRGAGYENDMPGIPEIYLRNQFKFGYKVNDEIEPYIGTEIRFQIRNPRIPYHDGFDRTRFFGGVNYELNKKNVIGAYYLHQIEWNVIDPETLSIIGIEYTFNF